MKKHLVWLLACGTTLLSCYKPQMEPGLKDNALNNNKTGATALLAGINYYVSTTGDDAADGSLGTPFLTINKALTVVTPGDTVFVRGGTYIEKVHFPVSGVKGSFVTLKEYPGETAIISGAGLTVTGDEGLVTIDSAQYIAIDGFDICNFKSSTGNPRGIVVKDGKDFTRLYNNQVYGINYEGAPQAGNSYGILFSGSTADPVSDILVSNNTIRDCQTGTGANLGAVGSVSSFTFSNNAVYNGTNIGISVTGSYENGAYRRPGAGTIQRNTVYNVTQAGISLLGGLTISADANYIHNNGSGIQAGGVINYSAGSFNILTNNMIWFCQGSGIVIGTPDAASTAGATNNYVLNNTLYHNNQQPPATGMNGEVDIQTNGMFTNLFNNIIYAGPADLFVSAGSTSSSYPYADHNMYYTEGVRQWRYNGTVINDIITWRTHISPETSSTYTIDPGFINTAAASLNLHLSVHSLAKNMGTAFTRIPATDIDGESRRVGAIDAGADELQ